ncbi:MAG: hypothetical protein WCJ01_10550 [Ignavibacteria bacterium]
MSLAEGLPVYKLPFHGLKPVVMGFNSFHFVRWVGCPFHFSPMGIVPVSFSPMGVATSLIYHAHSGLRVSGTGNLLFAFALKGHNITAPGTARPAYPVLNFPLYLIIVSE